MVRAYKVISWSGNRIVKSIRRVGCSPFFYRLFLFPLDFGPLTVYSSIIYCRIQVDFFWLIQATVLELDPEIAFGYKSELGGYHFGQPEGSGNSKPSSTAKTSQRLTNCSIRFL